jgi:hypothetical protein
MYKYLPVLAPHNPCITRLCKWSEFSHSVSHPPNCFLSRCCLYQIQTLETEFYTHIVNPNPTLINTATKLNASRKVETCPFSEKNKERTTLLPTQSIPHKMYMSRGGFIKNDARHHEDYEKNNLLILSNFLRIHHLKYDSASSSTKASATDSYMGCVNPQITLCIQQTPPKILQHLPWLHMKSDKL